MLLRPIRQSDSAVILSIVTDSRVNKTYMLPDYAQPEDAMPLFRRLLDLSHAEDRFVRAMEADGQCVGFLNDVERNGSSIELGYVVHPDHWGKGHATAALVRAIGQLQELGYRQVITGAFRENTASIRVMEKAGMTRMEKEDTIEYRGTVHTCVYYHSTNKTE